MVERRRSAGKDDVHGAAGRRGPVRADACGRGVCLAVVYRELWRRSCRSYGLRRAGCDCGSGEYLARGGPGQRGGRLVAEKMTWRKVGEQMVEVYQEMLKSAARVMQAS